MNTTVKVRKIGNSRGVLFTKEILDKSGIKDTIQITVKNKFIIISAIDEEKKKWKDFKNVSNQTLDLVQNEFDKSEWTWD